MRHQVRRSLSVFVSMCFVTTCFAVSDLASTRASALGDPDLHHSSYGVELTKFVGETISITCPIGNSALFADAGGFWWGLYLTPDTTLHKYDIELGEWYHDGIGANCWHYPTVSFVVPAVYPRSYYIAMWVDIYNSVTESDEDNNIGIVGQMTVYANINLHAISVSGSAFCTQGGTASVSMSLSNTGTQTAEGIDPGVYLSADTIYSQDDILLVGLYKSSLESGATWSGTWDVNLPADLTGVFHYILDVDRYGMLTETDENDNFVISTDTVMIHPASYELDVQVEVDALRMPGDFITLDVLVTYQGIEVDPTEMTWSLFGTENVMDLASARIGVGLYRVQYQLPGDTLPGRHTLVVSATYDAVVGPVIGTSLSVVEVGSPWSSSVLDISVDTSDMYFPYQMATFDVLYSYQGALVDPTERQVEVFGTFRHGAPWIDEERISQGFYRYSTTFPGAPAAPVTLVVNASVQIDYTFCHGVEMKSLPTGASIDGINAYLESITDDIAWISSAVGDLQFNLAALDAKVVDVDGDVATIGTNVGLIKTDLETINGVVSVISGNVATIQTDLGIVKVDVADIRAQVTEINGRTATIHTDIGDLNVDVHWINATIMSTIGNRMRVSTTVGTIDVDKSQIDMSYIPSAIEPKNGVDPAMYVGMAILAMSSFAAGTLTRSSVGPGKGGPRRRSH